MNLIINFIQTKGVDMRYSTIISLILIGLLATTANAQSNQIKTGVIKNTPTAIDALKPQDDTQPPAPVAQPKGVGITTPPIKQGVASPAISLKSIAVKSPLQGSEHPTNKPLTITWDKAPISSYATVNIILVDKAGGALQTSIRNNAPNTGSFSMWTPSQQYASKGASWVVRIETTDKKASGQSGIFSIFQPPTAGMTAISTGAAPMAGMTQTQPSATTNTGALAIGTIKILQPASGARLKEGSKSTIEFESDLLEPFNFYLINAANTEKVMNCQVGPLKKTSDSKFTTEWVIPEWDYNDLGNRYRILITKGVSEATSDSFGIENTLKKSQHEIKATKTVNKYTYHYHRYDKDSFVTESPGEEPDPGQGKSRVGYNFYKDNKQYKNTIYRSWVFFDLTNLRGKGIVTKASLKFSHYAGCNNFTPNVSIVNDQWNGDGKTLFSISSNNINPSNINTSIITNWILKPEYNYGLIFIGPNENLYIETNDECISMIDNITLLIELSSQ